MSSHNLFKNTKFFYYFWTQLLGALNDNIYKNALVVLIAFKGIEAFGLGKSLLVTLSGALFILPFFLFSPIAGQLCEKYEKSLIIRWTKILEIVVMLMGALGYYLDNYELLLVVLFLMGAQSALFGPVKYSILPEIVSSEQLMKANAYVESATFVAILIGTMWGGYLASLGSAYLAISISVVVIAVLGYLTSVKIPSLPLAAPRLKLQYNPLPEMIDLFKISIDKKVVFYSLLGISWFWFFGAAILSVLPVYCQEYLGVNETVLTFFLAAFTLGIGVGSILCEKLSRHKVNVHLISSSALLMSIFLADLSRIRPDWDFANGLLDATAFFSHAVGYRSIIDIFLMSVAGGMFIVPLYTLMQEKSAANVRSRVVAANNILNSLFMVISALIIMFLYKQGLSHSMIFLVVAILNLFIAYLAYTLRGLRLA